MVSMTRPIDNLGRVVIPMEIRKQLNWEPGTKVDICGTENGIQLTTHVENSPISQMKRCCGSSSNSFQCLYEKIQPDRYQQSDGSGVWE